MKKVLVIALWEYVERVRKRIFLLSLLLMPLMMISLGILPVILSGGGEGEETRVLAIADCSGDLFPRFAARLTEQSRGGSGGPLLVIRPLDVPSQTDENRVRAEGDRLVLKGDVDGFCLLRKPEAGRYVVEYRTAGVDESARYELLGQTLKSILLDDLLLSLGMSPSAVDWLDSAVVVNRTVLSSVEGESREYSPDEFGQVFFSAYVFLMMLFFAILSSGQLLVRSVLEEKMNRIAEILVSACTSTELLTGKMLGLSGLGFTQIAAWAGIAMVLSATVGFPFPVPENLLLLLIYFVLGYLLYASIFVAVGSPVTTEQEAQHVTGYLVIVLVIPLVLTVPAIQQPGATWIAALSYIPLLTPAMMGLRITLGVATGGEILATVLLLLLSIVLSLFVAGRIFRVAILATGKSPTLTEVISWVRSEA